ncbi:hypothetical protein MACK_001077 [Theileria orientalis]|uniref:Uncharacterized protein n=1 Tax=Theileria orientalis TaxID=68886 RepID=A0A976MCB6_THEOR|nr:hypothetical protein MACK_001077 [Theileria orientalis]
MTSIYLGVQTRFHHRTWVIVTVRCARNCEKSCSELTKYNYKCYWHRVTQLEEALIKRTGAIALKFENRTKRVTKVLLMSHTARLRRVTLVDIYVYFYGCDPRPLLICIGGCAYAPRSKNDYCKCWCRVAEVKQDSCVCGCPGAGTRAACTEHDALFIELTKVVGFLNRVNLWYHPGMTGGAVQTGQACPTGDTSSPTAATQCQPSQTDQPTTNGSTCTYPVHTYKGQQIKVQVKCEPVNAKSGSTCYRKLTHQPIGTGSNGATNGFRLGDVEYCPNGGSRRTGTIDYYGNGSNGAPGNGNLASATNKYSPLTSVRAYFYDQDKGYCDPLLVVLEFNNGSTGTEKECYKLTSSASGTKLEWEKDTDACKKVVEGQDTDNGKLARHLDSIRYCLKKVVKVELHHNKASDGYSLVGREAKKGTGSGFDQSINGTGTVEVKVEVCECKCDALTDSNYRCVKHDLTTALAKYHDQVAGLAFTLPGQGGKEAELKLHNQYMTPIMYNRCMGDIYVYFYGDDPRPLLLSYNKQAYSAKSMNEYDLQKWHKDQDADKCDCSKPQPDQCKLVASLVRVSNFLNPVKLHQVPQIHNNRDYYTIHWFNTQPIRVKVEEKKADKSFCYNRYTHKHFGVGCGGEGFRLGDVAYCRNGTGSRHGTKREGKIDYYGNGSNGADSSPGNGNLADTNKYNPLTSVRAYFYNADTDYKDPLLVVLEFAKATLGNGTEKECYRLKPGNGDTGLEWAKDTTAKSLVGQPDNGKLVAHLDGIRYCLKYVLKVELRHNQATQYALVGRKANGTSKGDFTPINGQEVSVTVHDCPSLSSGNYRCFRHGLTTALKGKQHLVAGLAFTLPGKNGVIEIPLFNGANGQCTVEGAATPVGQDVACPNGPVPGSAPGAKITYNKCMGDVCVYFYHPATGGSTSDQQTDTVPLMLQYNGQFYKPQDRDSYFKKWECVKELCTVDECGCSVSGSGGHGPECQQLVDKLDEVNLALNRIDLDKSSGPGYGLPENGQGGGSHKLEETVGNVRVKVVTQKPSDTDAKSAYQRVVHRTKNGFQIGKIMYNNQEIVANGITPDGGDTTIPIANGGHKNHKDLVSSNSWNTVVSYYSKTDSKHQLPQLIVILKTDAPLNGGEQTVTGSADTAYGYYVLATKSGVGGGGTGSGYEYKWVEVKEKPATGVELNDETDFKLLNAGVILLERRDASTGGGSYGEEDINKAVTSAIQNESLKESPGNKGQINRLTGKKITVTDETEETSAGDYTCLSGTNFKVMAHDLDNLVKLNGQFGGTLSTVALITGLKFLIPTNEKDKYRKVKLKDNNTAGDVQSNETGSDNIKYHKNGNNKICVYFYGSDPRPLLVSYNGWAYAAKDKDAYDRQEWTKVTELDKCGCTDPPSSDKCENCKLLIELVRVSDFLNPVDINVVAKCPKYYKHYFVQEFNGQLFWIRVSAQPACGSFCFDRYTHTHAGTKGRSGKGFRLGNIHYKSVEGQDSCIKLVDGSGTSVGSNNGNNNKCISASQGKNGDQKCGSFPFVVVFYYKLDSERKNPIVVAMCTGTCTDLKCELYYILKDRAGKKYKKGSGTLTMDDPKKLGDQLDAALFTNSKHLRVVLAARPVPRDYKAEKDKKCENDKPEESSSQGPYVMDYHDNVKKMAGLRSCNVKTLNSIATAPDSDEKKAKLKPMLYHVLRETSYEAQLFEANGTKPASPPPSTLSITVKEVNCHKSYSQGGYRCFQHLLTTATGIEQVGGLKLAVFDGKGAQGSAAEITLCEGDKSVQLSYTTCKGDLYVF